MTWGYIISMFVLGVGMLVSITIFTLSLTMVYMMIHSVIKKEK